jgi:hypothetical protein
MRRTLPRLSVMNRGNPPREDLTAEGAEPAEKILPVPHRPRRAPR